MAGGPCHSNLQGLHRIPALIAKSNRLPPEQKRQIDHSLMSDTLRKANKGVKNTLQTYISLDVGDILSSEQRAGPLCLLPALYKAMAQRDLDYIRDHCPETYMNGDDATDAYKLSIIAATDHNESLVDASYTRAHWTPWFEWLARPDSNLDSLARITPAINRAVQNSGIFRDFRFAVSKHGYFCLVPHVVRTGDMVAVLTGYMTCVVLRPHGKGGGFMELLGDAYVHGMMSNEAPCIMLELGCKANASEEEAERVERKAGENAGEAWKTLGLGDYTRILRILGKRKLDIV